MKGMTPKMCILCFVLINSALLNLLRAWILSNQLTDQLSPIYRNCPHTQNLEHNKILPSIHAVLNYPCLIIISINNNNVWYSRLQDSRTCNIRSAFWFRSYPTKRKGITTDGRQQSQPIMQSTSALPRTHFCDQGFSHLTVGHPLTLLKKSMLSVHAVIRASYKRVKKS